MRLAPKPAADSQQSDGKTRPRWTNFYFGNENHHKCLAGVLLKQNIPKGSIADANDYLLPSNIYKTIASKYVRKQKHSPEVAVKSPCVSVGKLSAGIETWGRRNKAFLLLWKIQAVSQHMEDELGIYVQLNTCTLIN